MRIKTRTVPPADEWSVHDGEELAYVIAGEIEFHTEHDTPVTLFIGDGCYFDSTMRHAYVCRSSADAVILSVCLSIIPFEPAKT
jgi:quercetin dioxygenase-like cupin family protein